ncbi:helix-turn-helix domain-containing protein [Streptomyces kaniharaensis]|uniref:Helix-turn-helix domain-containing protein n=1 Tax=Streptomyces kaniharaensis TaxID=212423 RepID=A0A6N7KMG6_9ACTN|nr:helix-turn-helix domain-containing protein [Streptomyces kaniharaensis]MQS11334.1 helix-turn-helix domain-containing protein [Streptomyces kaniharaensis]
MLEQTVYRSEDVPAADRFDCWRRLVRQTHAPLDLTTPHTEDFRAVQRVLHLDGLSVWPCTFKPVLFRRTPRLIRASDPESVNVSLPISGPLESTLGDHQAVYPPYSLCVVSSSRPIDVWAGRTGARHTGIGLEIPRTRLTLPRDGVARLANRPLPTDHGFGAVLAQLLLQITRETDHYQPSDGPRLAAVIAEVVSSLFAAALETRPASAGPGRVALLLRIKSFITDHLHDPDLTPATVAAAHHISLSYLHRLFQEDGTSVSAWTRRRRLDRARRDLADPGLNALPVHAIATRWGFRHASDFTRAFRTTYGTCPRDYRRDHQLPGPGD